MAYPVELSVRPNRAFMQFDGLRLSCFTPDEVRRISVLDVTQTTTFDDAGFPLRGGLYDPVLGPSGNGPCETCGLLGDHCPGHYGHIQLTVPVFNPLLYAFTLNLMKGTCIHCHRFTFDTNSFETKAIIAKLRAIDFGCTEVLDRVEGALKTKHEKTELINERIDVLSEKTFLQEIDSLIAELNGMAGGAEELREWAKRHKNHCIQLKNNVVERNSVLKKFSKEQMFKRKLRCPRCKQSNGILRNDNGLTFLLDFSKQGNAEQKKQKSNKKQVGQAPLKTMLEEAKRQDTFNSSLIENETERPDLGFLNYELEDSEFKPDLKMSTKDIKSAIVTGNGLIDPLSVSDQLLSDQLQQVLNGQCDKLAWRAAEVREHLRLVWKRDGILIKQLFNFFIEFSLPPVDENSTYSPKGLPIDALFIETISVEPNRYRPLRSLKGEQYEHPTTVNLRKLLDADQLLTLIKLHLEGEKGVKRNKLEKLDLVAKELIEDRIAGKTMNEKLHNAYQELQMRANALFDQTSNRTDGKGSQPGLKQLLEKKEGLFRMHMMGKRVNFACRSVITPDPYLDIDEIGIPELFARRLTFSEPVSYLNQRSIKELVQSGPAKHPGANFIEFSGTLGKPPSRVKIPHAKNMAKERGYLSTKLRLGDVSNVHSMPDHVLRHLQNGDKLLMNRQPSLHKPSIMGHRARVLTGQNALRMNYAPCKAYNADFDGDEMNGHFVQNRVAQCEAAELTNVGNNYLVPKDGTPILGLIQDHVVSGVIMTIRGRFFSKEDFMHLVLAAFAQNEKRLRIPHPTIVWPVKLWSGKQVITAIIQNCCPQGKPLINLSGKAKTGITNWKTRDPKTGKEIPILYPDLSETEVIFREGELLCGVLDKAHYGATQFGLIHCCYELYGPQMAVQLLSCFSRVFTTYLQFHGFTLGVADILVTRRADSDRKKTIGELRKCSESVAKKTFGLMEEANYQRIKHSLAMAYNHPREDRTMIKQYDYTMKQTLSKYTEQINGFCVPSGLICEFPHNALQLMIQSGAKGSLVNSIQISCALGQIELEGQRPPRSITGRSLPSFRSFDPTPRAGGFVDQRFLTGINSQELFFHTMAGREGLIDTAVKTSRSGYLQRCIIKHLEGLVIQYDNTVRDHDGSIIQFRYGEDGLDVGHATFLDHRHFPFLFQNAQTIRQQILPPNITEEAERVQWNLAETEKQFRKISKFKRKQVRKRLMMETQQSDGFLISTANKGVRNSAFLEFCRHRHPDELKRSLISEWLSMSTEKKFEFAPKHSKAPTPVDVKFHPVKNLGALPERMLEQLEEFVGKKASIEKGKEFKQVINWKGLHALADPGECVGLLAAQSIGEPSTQMTLNTFHFAGRGEMNVTLGIPRLREILMTQSKHISTPMAEICFYSEVSEEQIDRIKSELNPVMLKDLLKKFVLEERVHFNEYGNYLREYCLRIELLRNTKRDPMIRKLKRKTILRELENRFGRQIANVLAKRFREVREYQQIQHKKLRASNLETGTEEDVSTRNKQDEEELGSDEEEAIGGARSQEVDAHEARLSKRHLDDAADYEGEDQDRNDAGFDKTERDENIGEVGGPADEEDSEAEQTIEVEENGVENREAQNSVDSDRVKLVLDSHAIIAGYEYDVQGERWCIFKMHVPFLNKNCIDALTIVEREIDRFVVSQVPGIEKCITREEQRKGLGGAVRVLQTQGINLEAFYLRSEWLDVDTVYSNDIDLILRTYGIEAAARTITREMNNVFGVYGIEVNVRHLLLVSDYMTFTGEVQPFSRGAMADSASPLQKMTFETTVSFMRAATITGQFDALSSPSARLVLGQLIRGGTGSFDLLHKTNCFTQNGEKNIKSAQNHSDIIKMRERRRERKLKFNL